MMWLYAFVCVMAGAVLNRFRGGGILSLPDETADHKRTQMRRIVWALGLALCAWNGWLAVVLMLSALTGWGYAVSVATGMKSGPREAKFWPLDKLAGWVTGKRSENVYGVVWLTLHGYLFGGLAYYATGSMWFLLWALMGPCYKVARDWERGEILYGAVQGFTIFLFVLTVQ